MRPTTASRWASLDLKACDAGIYGFIANIHFYEIDTPLKQFVTSHPNLIRHCTAIHAAIR
jgi:Glutathione S-transferase, C-terminal domain